MTLAAIEALGVVGAGGAGFPAHAKLDSRPDTVLVNAAECEPLLHKDMEILRHHPGEVLRGLAAAMEVTGAGRGIIGIKGKHEQEIALLRPLLPSCVSVARLEDVYPAGDEITLITAGGIALRTAVENVRVAGRPTLGVRVISLDEGDRLASLARLEANPEENARAAAEAAAEASVVGESEEDEEEIEAEALDDIEDTEEAAAETVE